MQIVESVAARMHLPSVPPRVRLVTLLPSRRSASFAPPRATQTGETTMADAPGDPQLFYTRHIFMCTNVRPDGHPRGCCMARAEAGGGVEKLRGYAREKARALGIDSIRWNA